MSAEPKVIRSWLRWDDVECVRGGHLAGFEEEPCYVIEGEGVICADHVTEAEKARAVPQT